MTGFVDYTNWPALRTTAERLLADRLRSDADAVKDQKLTAADADARERVGRSLVAIWTAIDTLTDIPERPAGDLEIRLDLEKVAQGAARLAAASPGDSGLARYAAQLATLAHHHRPYGKTYDTASIVFCHECNQQARAERAARPSKQPPELPPAPPLRRSGLL